MISSAYIYVRIQSTNQSMLLLGMVMARSVNVQNPNTHTHTHTHTHCPNIPGDGLVTNIVQKVLGVVHKETNYIIHKSFS